MAKDAFDIIERLEITPEVCALLGKTVEEIRKMDLYEFSGLVYEKGYEVAVSSRPSETDKGKLTITTDVPTPLTAA